MIRGSHWMLAFLAGNVKFFTGKVWYPITTEVNFSLQYKKALNLKENMQYELLTTE
jgi:hypothetical protein